MKNNQDEIRKIAIDSIDKLKADILSNKVRVLELDINNDVGTNMYDKFGYTGYGTIIFKLYDNRLC